MNQGVMHNANLNRSDAYKFVYEQHKAIGDFDLADIYFSLYLEWKKIEKERLEEAK